MLRYKHETPSLDDIREFFYRTDKEFDIPVSQKVNVEEYTLKLYTYADFFVCYDNDRIVGMICCYINRPPHAYISHVCVDSEYQGKGIFKELFSSLIDNCEINSILDISLEVGCFNLKAQMVYKKFSFMVKDKTENSYRMVLSL